MIGLVLMELVEGFDILSRLHFDHELHLCIWRPTSLFHLSKWNDESPSFVRTCAGADGCGEIDTAKIEIIAKHCGERTIFGNIIEWEIVDMLSVLKKHAILAREKTPLYTGARDCAKSC